MCKRYVVVLTLGLASMLLPTAQAAASDLLANPGFETVVPIPTGLPTDVGHWAQDVLGIVGSQQGIFPMEGSHMLEFIYTGHSGPSATGNSSEACQLVDLTPVSSLVNTSNATATLSAYFNRVVGDAQTDRQFGVEIRAFAGLPSTYPDQVNVSEIGFAEWRILTDAELSTWEFASVSLLIPSGADFLAVRLFAHENIFNDGSAPEFDGHFADAAALEIVPEPATLSLLAVGLGVLAIRRHQRNG